MTEYYPSFVNGEWFAANSATGEHVGGPYDTEAKAKRRIRDLKRKDAEQKAGDIVEQKAEYYKNVFHAHLFRPAGVYPHVAKKHYRAQWKLRCHV